MSTVTVTKKRRRAAETSLWENAYTLEFSRLPGKVFGPWHFVETIRDLQISALLSPLDARDLVVDATVDGSATRSLS